MKTVKEEALKKATGFTNMTVISYSPWKYSQWSSKRNTQALRCSEYLTEEQEVEINTVHLKMLLTRQEYHGRSRNKVLWTDMGVFTVEKSSS